MSFFDFTIIYLACGAPVAAYYFFQNRECSFLGQRWLKTILNFLFWPPPAFRLLRQARALGSFPSVVSKTSKSEAELEARLFVVQRRIEQLFAERFAGINIYDLREVLERYAGLSLICEDHAAFDLKREKDFFRVAGRRDFQQSAACLYRRNQKRLLFHQTQARKDFLKMISPSGNSISDQAEVLETATEFAKLLTDAAAQAILEKTLASIKQIENAPRVNQTELDLWKSDRLKPIPAEHILMKYQTAAATRSASLKKD